jgi:trimeric autotransporter adhesin
MKTSLKYAMWGAVLVCVCSTSVFSQQNGGSVIVAAAQLPRLVKFSGTLKDSNGNPLTTITGVTFALYSQQNGGAPLWLETQNVQPDKSGHYTVMLGSTKPDGLETELFVSEQAQWLGIQPQGQEEHARVLLVSVPYALKAGDAETLGGKPASAFMPANPMASAGSASLGVNSSTPSSSNRNLTPAAALTGTGTANFIPKWTTSSNLGNSKIFQSTTGNVGIGTTTPTATLDVSGTTFLSGTSGSTFAMTVYSPAQLAEVVEGPVTGVGAGLDLKTTGTGGKQWEILATGKTSSQGVGKFNIRDVTTSTDVLTIDASDTVNVRNLSANNQTLNGALTASSGSDTIYATSTSNSAAAVIGNESASTGSTYGVIGKSASSAGYGVLGSSSAISGTTYGVYGVNSSTLGAGVHGSSPFIGVQGDQGGSSVLGAGYGNAGVWGDTGGAAGTAHTGVLGTADNNYAGYFADSSSDAPTLYAENFDATVGDEIFRAYMADVGTYAIIGDPGCNTGFMGLQLGQGGMSNCSNYTLTGGNNGDTYINALFGSAVHLRVSNVDQLVATSANVDVLGTLSKGGGSFKIDHPLDPANKYLYHSFVESPDMKNMYDGNITTDDAGLASVTLPNWFETLNRDFRYQLTVIGQFAQAIVASEISGNQFSIRTDKPNVKVSWQVTGTRQDAFANAHRIEVEVEKAPADRGHYLYPELVGAPATARIGYMAPAPGSEHIVHHRPTMLKRGNASPSQQRTPPSIPIPPPMPVAPNVAPMPHPAAPVGKLAVNQKQPPNDLRR